MKSKPNVLAPSPLSALFPAASFMIVGTVMAVIASANEIYPQNERIPAPSAGQVENAPVPTGPVVRVEPFDRDGPLSASVPVNTLSTDFDVQLVENRVSRKESFISYQISDGRVVSAEVLRVLPAGDSS